MQRPQREKTCRAVLPLSSPGFRLQFIKIDLVLPLSVGAGMVEVEVVVVASACRASGLMGKNDRNLQLIMPRSEMFVSR